MRRQPGFTLIEMVLTLILLVIISMLLMVSLKNPLDALTYFKQSFATVEPMVWVDQALKKPLRESQGLSIMNTEKTSTLKSNQEEGGLITFECDHRKHTLVQRVTFNDEVFEGTLLTQVNCHFHEKALNQGKQIHLALELHSLGQAFRFNRYYYGLK